jgi:hypothetical protein
MGIQLHPHPRKTWPPTIKIDSAAVGCSYVLILAFLLPGLYWVDFVEHRLSRNLRGTGHAWPDSWICFFSKSGCSNENRTGPMFLREDCGIPMVSSIFSQPNRPNDSCAPLLAVLFFEFTNFQSPDPAESLTSGLTGRPNHDA